MSRLLRELDKLDRSLLHVFVAGPGFGEGIAIALPEKGWILVDGCRTGGRAGQDLPLLAILRRWRRSDDEPIEWMLFTHPHEDHADGFAEVVDALTPVRIGMMGPPRRGGPCSTRFARQRGTTDSPSGSSREGRCSPRRRPSSAGSTRPAAR